MYRLVSSVWAGVMPAFLELDPVIISRRGRLGLVTRSERMPWRSIDRCPLQGYGFLFSIPQHSCCT